MDGSATDLAWLREQLRDVAALWALTDGDTERVVMVVNELASNAIEHARTPYRVTVRCSGLIVRVLVTDLAPTPPVIQPFNPLATRGRGLQVVQAETERWGWTRHASCKAVWATIGRAGPTTAR
jgi:anti-sigma regulatory factor (Ser/Thr protein kinase)